MQAPNSHLLPLACSPKSRGVYTGERLARDRPEVYSEIVELLASGASVNWIALHCRVSRHTIRAVRERETDSIAQFQIRLTFKCSWIAEAALDQIGKALATRKLSARLLLKIYATCVDLFLKLTRDMAPSLEPVYDIPHQQITALLPGLVGEPAKALPNGKSASNSAVETHLLAEKTPDKKH